MIDAKRFSEAPCYLCGYNGERYYQPDTHACAIVYHAEADGILELEIDVVITETAKGEP